MKRTFSALVESVKRKKWQAFVATLCVMVLLVTLAAGCRGNQPMAPDGGGGDSPGVTTTTTAATTATIKDEPLATETGDEMAGATTTTTVNTSSLDKTETTAQGGSASVTKATVSKTTKTQATKATKTTSGEKPAVVQRADPNTGISWDGKSPIVYTYEDGTTGTTPKDGATYEGLPGMITTYNAPKDVQVSDTCSRCGKVSGDGKHGTCARWLMGDVDCPNCGEHVEAHTCHTCDE